MSIKSFELSQLFEPRKSKCNYLESSELPESFESFESLTI